MFDSLRIWWQMRKLRTRIRKENLSGKELETEVNKILGGRGNIKISEKEEDGVLRIDVELSLL